MRGPGLRQRAQAEPIHLRADRFEALVSAHEAFLAGRPGGRRAALQFIVARQYRCDGRNLSDARLDGANLSGSSFRGAQLSRASLYCANLSRCDFTEATLQRADLRGCSFTEATLTGANLDQADLRAAALVASDEIKGLRWVGGRTQSPGPGGDDAGAAPFAYSVDFTNCSLQGARLRDANLKNANFAGANLHGAEFAGAKLEGAHLRGAILTGIDVSRLGFSAAALAGCVLDPTRESLARVDAIRRELDRAHEWITKGGTPANLDGFDLRPAGEYFRDRLLVGLRANQALAVAVDFSGAQLQGASFEGADLRGANFARADLRGVSFVGANLAHARFEGAKMGELELNSRHKLPTRLDSALLVGTGLQG